MNTAGSNRPMQLYGFPEGSRDPRFPEVYLVDDHPLHPPENPGRTFVVKIRPTFAAMQEQEEFQKSLEIPKGQKKDLDAAGWLEIKPGDYVFKRNVMGTNNPEDDVVAMWNVGGHLQSNDDKAALEAAVERALGDADERTAARVYLEKYFQPVKPGVRCFTMASSYERQPSIVAPCASLKNSIEPDVAQSISRELTEVVMRMAMKNMSFAPRKVQDAIQARTEMLGLPRVGVRHNWAYQTLQCNISAVAAQKDGNLGGQMGTFGEAHFDDCDSGGHYTNMIPCSQLPSADYDPGYFFNLGLGMYVRLWNFNGFNFQGPEKHGGSGPFAPAGVTPPPDAYRFMNVSYPPGGMMDPLSTRYRFSMTPSGALYIAPEMRQIEYKAPQSSAAESATFCKQGSAYMDRESHVEFLVRGLYDVNRYSVNQVHGDVGLTIDAATFVKAFKYRNGDGHLVDVPISKSQPLIPPAVDGPVPQDIEDYYKEGEARWQQYYDRTAGLIPLKFMRSEKLRCSVNPGIVDEIMPTAVAGPSGTHSGGKRKADGAVGSSPSKRRAVDEDGAVDKSGHNNEEGRTNKGKTTGTVSVPRVLKSKANGKGNKGKDRDTTTQVIESSGGRTDKANRNGKDRDTATQFVEASGGRMNNANGKGNKGGKQGKATNAGVSQGLPFTFAFTKASTAYALELEVQQVIQELSRSPAGIEEGEYRDKAVESLTRLDVVQRRNELTAVTDIGTLAYGAKALQQNLSRQAHVARTARRVIVAAKTRVWEYLEKDLLNIVGMVEQGDVMDLDGDSYEWLSLLATDVRAMHRDRLMKKSFSSTQYEFGDADRDVVVNYINRKPGRRLGGKELGAEVRAAVKVIVGGWLGCMDEQDQKLSWFVSIIREVLGEEALTMDYTWQLISHFRATYVVAGRADRAKVEDTMEFRKELLRHPIAIESTKESVLYLQYKALVNGRLVPKDVGVLGKSGPAWAKYTHMWRMAMEYDRNPRSGSTDAFFNVLQEDSDFWSPSREQATSRKRVKGEDGPYAPTVVTTNRGVFSALLFRAVTFRTRFFHENQMVFDSWADYAERVQAIIDERDEPGFNSKDVYFCNIRAYGQPNEQRSVANAEKYWAALEERHWSGFSSSPKRPSFLDMLQWFRPTDTKHRTLFPNLGPLGGLALAGDMAYAQVCEMPTLTEMANIMVDLASGAIGGLQVLELLPDKESFKKIPKVQRVDMVKVALEEVMQFCQVTFTDAEREQMGWNIIVLEHSLCKLSRGISKKKL